MRWSVPASIGGASTAYRRAEAASINVKAKTRIRQTLNFIDAILTKKPSKRLIIAIFRTSLKIKRMASSLNMANF